MKHFRRADVFISLGKPSHQKCGIFSANLRKYHCLVYKNECICLMIDRSLCGLGGLCGASVGGRDGYDSLHAFKTFLFCPPPLKKVKEVNLKGIDHTHGRHEYSFPEALLTCGAPSPHVPSKKKNHSL